MSETYNPSVQLTFLPKTSGLIFGDRFQARSDKGRIFLSAGGYTPGPGPGPDPGPDGPGTYCTDVILSVGGGEVYSSGPSTGTLNVVAGAPGSWSVVFDGETVLFAETSTGAELTLPTPVPFTKLEVYIAGSNVGINGSPFSGSGWVDASSAGSPFSSIVLTNLGIIHAVRVDGVMLVDGETFLTFPTDNNFDKFEVGDVVQGAPGTNQSQIWSADLTTDGSFRPGYPATNLFDGNENTNVDVQSTSGATYLLFDISDSPIPVTKLEVRGAGGSAPRDLVLNGNTNTTTTFTNSTVNTIEIPLAGETEIKTIRMDAPCAMNFIKVNGKLLVDSSVPGGVSITAIDDTVPSITVDGGSWLGVDGTGDFGDTQVCKTIKAPEIGVVSATVNGANYPIDGSVPVQVLNGNTLALVTSITGDASPTYNWSVKQGSATLSGSGSTISATIESVAPALVQIQCDIIDADASDNPYSFRFAIVVGE